MSGIEDFITKKQKASTEFSVETILYTWTVNNFSLLSQFSKKKICSPNFSVLNTPFQLHIHRSGDTETEPESVGINLYKQDQDGKNLRVKYKIGLVDDKNVWHIVQHEMLFTDKRRASRRLEFYTKDMPQSIFADDKLKIHCNVTVLRENAVNYSDHKIEQHIEIMRRNRKRRISHRLFRTYFWFFCVFAIALICNHPALHLEHTHNECALYHEEVHQFVIDSTRKLLFIGETLNLSNVTMMASEFMSLYLHKFDLTLESPVLSMNSTSSH